MTVTFVRVSSAAFCYKKSARLPSQTLIIMTISKISTLVSTSWLKQQILPASQKLSSNLRVLESTWEFLPDIDGSKCYHQHIPTALHFDLKEISPAIEGTFHKFTIPEPKVFKQYVEDLGISNHTHVVVYDAMLYKPAFRTWFLLRLFGHDNVSVLNGGLNQWQKEGHPLTSEVPKVESGDFEPNFRRHLLRDFDSMTTNVKTQAEQVADTRDAVSFSGTERETDGHIPGSVNMPFDTFFNKDGTFKSVDVLKTMFDKANVDLNKPLVATCFRAMTACSLIGAAHMLGKEDVPVYNGSWTEWGVRADSENILRLKKKE